eukprot:1461430-Rhodomonas_salina.2
MAHAGVSCMSKHMLPLGASAPRTSQALLSIPSSIVPGRSTRAVSAGDPLASTQHPVADVRCEGRHRRNAWDDKWGCTIPLQQYRTSTRESRRCLRGSAAQ